MAGATRVTVAGDPVNVLADVLTSTSGVTLGYVGVLIKPLDGDLLIGGEDVTGEGGANPGFPLPEGDILPKTLADAIYAVAGDGTGPVEVAVWWDA